jgi:hypothetical protein
LLLRHSATPISTDALLKEIGFKEAQRKPLLGALKAEV